MSLNQEILQALKKNNNMITTSQVQALGYSKTLLTQYVSEGLLDRSRHGLYTLSDSTHDDMYTLGLRSKNIIFSHDTALFLNNLSNRTPFTHSITIPSNASLPASIKNECICYYIKPELHLIGLIEKKTTFGNNVKTYNIERTICDLLRSRNRLDEELIISAMKNYAHSQEKNLNLLAEYSLQFKVSKKIKTYLEVLL